MSFNMFDMEFSDLDPLMSADDVTEADFLDLGDSLVGDNMHEVQSFRDLHDDPQQLTLLIKSTSQEDDYEQAASFSDFQPLPKSFNKKKTSQSRNNSKVIHRPASRNAARERSRVKSLRCAFLDLQNSLPSVPPNTKLSKLDVLVLATTYIAHLMKVLEKPEDMTAITDSINSQHLHHSASNNNYNDFYIGNYTNKFPGTQTLMSKPLSNNKRSDKNTDSHHRLHEKGYLHPVRKWPMRSRLYAGAIEEKSGPQFQLPTYISALNNDYLKFDNL